jgi:hypothetical protein
VSTPEESKVVPPEVTVVFEPSRGSGENITHAYNLLVPITRKPMRTRRDNGDSEQIGADRVIGGYGQ